MTLSYLSTGLWADTCAIPDTLSRTVDSALGFDEAVAELRRSSTRRVVVTGNGASYYVAMSLWLASLEGVAAPFEVLAVPGGLVAAGRFAWRAGDVAIVISASGEFRDVIEAVEDDRFPRPFILVTSTPDSTLGRIADVCVLVDVAAQQAVTHTFAFTNAVAACLLIWARVTGDADLARAVGAAPDSVAAAIAATDTWAAEAFATLAIPPAAMCFGEGPAWAGALENALLIKEVSRFPCEGVEVREAVTATMTGMLPGQLAIGLPTRDDPFIDEARELCHRLGFVYIEAPGGALTDHRLAAATTFPAVCALSAQLAVAGEWNPDDPIWITTYYETARRKPMHPAASQPAS